MFAGTTRGAAITTTTSVGARTLGPTAEGARWPATIHTMRTETAEATSPVTEAGTGITGDKLSTLLTQKFYTCKNIFKFKILFHRLRSVHETINHKVLLIF